MRLSAVSLCTALAIVSLAWPQQPPMIESTTPAIGDAEVDPSLTEISVTFDQDMATGGWSWTGGGEHHPELTESPRFSDARTCVAPVRLEPGRFYRIGINSTSHQNFRSAAGVPTPPRAIYFCTTGAPSEEIAFLTPPAVVGMTPENSQTDVDPEIGAIIITFSQPMGGGRSVTGGGDLFPTVPEGGEMIWSDDHRTFTIPVDLEHDHDYRFGLNSFSHVNFQSDHGVPLEPVQVTFRTRAAGDAPAAP